jgi:hypothetical protein
MSFHNQGLFEAGCDLIMLAKEQDANTDITGDWIKMRDYARVGILLAKFGTEDVDDLGLQFQQATSNGGTPKALSLPANRPIYYKTGTLTSQTTWTQTSSTTATDGIAFGASVPTGFTRIVADVNTSALLLYTELLASDMDADNGYNWMTAFIEGDNVDNTCLITLWAVLMGGKFCGAVPLSSIS